jgi:hypothetical protein
VLVRMRRFPWAQPALQPEEQRAPTDCARVSPTAPNWRGPMDC